MTTSIKWQRTAAAHQAARERMRAAERKVEREAEGAAVRTEACRGASLVTLLFFLVTACICLAMLPAPALADENQDYDIGWYLNHVDEDEFEIGTEGGDAAAELRGLSALVNGTAQDSQGQSIAAVSFEGKTIYQTASINLGETEFTPIGTADHPFCGTFDGAPDGNAFTIADLCITQTYENAGLFGVTGAASTLRNVRLVGGEHGSIALASDSATIANVGSLAGWADGAVENCSSEVSVAIDSTLNATDEVPYVVERVGGLIGYARANVSGCAYTGDLTATIGSAALHPDTTSESLRVADSFGGVVGKFGDPDKHGTLTNSHNLGNVTVTTTGTGALDRFGTTTYAVAFFVGGVVGYSNGSIQNCYNGAYDELTQEVTGSVFTGVKDENGTLLNNRGADEVGGICGSLRGESDDPDRYNDGDPDDPMVLSDCYNEAQVTGLAATGGICGQTGVYCTITRCYNGTMSDSDDWTRNQIAGKVVSTRWNKPFSAGIVGQCRSGVVSYCANYAEVRNIQTGYYMAGIAGCIFTADDAPNVTGEIYACVNTGGVYTINTSTGSEYREAGICGENEGSVHDCLVLKGSVPYHSDSPIGANTWGDTNNLEIWDSDQLQSGNAAAFLNSQVAQNQNWTESCYWFINGSGYPVLNTWANLDESERTELTADKVASVTQIEPAPYTGSTTLPTLSVTLTDGTVLVQNADFYVIPDESGVEMTDELAYSAGIVGLGRYTGTLQNCTKYSIGMGDLSRASLQVKKETYNFGKVVLPTQVKAVLYGREIDAAEYDYVVYNLATNKENVTDKKGAFAVFDSAGYISYTEGGEKTPVSSIDLAKLNGSDTAWWLYDRNEELISDSAGAVYYTSTSGGGKKGAVYKLSGSKVTSCVTGKTGAPAGYIVQATAKSTSTALQGSAIGYYVIEPVDLYKDCTLESATVDGQTWYWDADTATFYTKNILGMREEGAVSVTFTGEAIEPKVKMTYNGRVLVEGTNYRLVYGDPEPSESGNVSVDETDANRNCKLTDDDARSAVTIAPVSTTNISNYINAYFTIAPAKFEDCVVSLDQEEWAYTGKQIKPVSVTLNGVTLKEDVDYEISYSDNVAIGEASYTVTPKGNLSGGSSDPKTGTFKIVAGENTDISDLTVAEIPDQQFNYGCDVHPTLSFTDKEGQSVELVEGTDYEVSYSTTQITKWADDDRIDPCTATITGIGAHAGELKATFDIVPYDATANATNQLRVGVQDMSYGAWGEKGKSTETSDGTPVVGDKLANYGLEHYPVTTITARAIVDWAAYGAGDYENCYGDDIPLSTVSDNANGDKYGAVSERYPVRYYDAANAMREVNGTGAVYLDADNNVIAEPERATPGAYYATVEFCTGTGDERGGATGVLTTDEFNYAEAEIGTVTWAPADKASSAYTGEALTPIVGTTASGLVLAEGKDYTIEYANNVDVGQGEASFTVTALDGSNFTGSYTGKFTIQPYDLSTAGDAVKVASIDPQKESAAGKAITPKPAVTLNGKTLTEGTDYWLSYENNTAATDAAVVIVNGTGNYTGSVRATFSIVKQAQSISGTSSFSKKYGDAAFSLGAKASGGGALTYESSNTKVVTVSSAGKVTIVGGGSATITVKAAATNGYAQATKSIKVSVAKAANPMVAKGRTATASYKKVKKANQSISLSKAFSISKAQGKVTFKKYSGNSKITVSSSGKVTVKKRLKKGTYKVKVKVTAAGTNSYSAKTTVVQIKVKVK